MTMDKQFAAPLMMAIEIINTEGVPAPKDGTIFNAQYRDGTLTKVRWDETDQDWQGANAQGRWLRL